MFRFIFALIACCLLAPTFAANAPAPTQEQRARVETILDAINQENIAGQVAEDALVKEGTLLLPAMQELLTAKREQLQLLPAQCKYLNHWEIAGGAAKLASQITALDQAIFRFTFNVNPRSAIIDWAHALKFPDGRAFARQFVPEPVLDVETDRLQRIFTTSRFYLVYLPGYQGGAAPSPWVLQAFMIPTPLQAINLFAVDKTGKVTLMTGPDLGVKGGALLHSLPRTTTSRDIAYAWLRLTTSFWWWNNEPLAFLPITEADISVMPGTANTSIVHGVVRVAPLNNNKGQLTVELTFDADGKQALVKETPEIELAPILLLPPCSPPPGGGIRPLPR